MNISHFAPPLDRETFVRPIAHRGLHTGARVAATPNPVIENTASAFHAAISKGVGIECDVRTTADHQPVVFHDPTTKRLLDCDFTISALTASDCAKLRYPDTNDHILGVSDALDLVRGKVPIFFEIKSAWGTDQSASISNLADHLRAYDGPAAVMSFDPKPLEIMCERYPQLPRGIVAAPFSDIQKRPSERTAETARQLAKLDLCERAAPSFVAYNVDALPTPQIITLRNHGWPVFAWTVRTSAQWDRAHAHADAPIFEDVDTPDE